MKTLETGRIGIDFGRVIMGAADVGGDADTSFLSGGEDRAMATPATVGSLEVIRELVRATDGKVFIVSKCGPRVAARTQRWLVHQRFFEQTGMPPGHVRFCRQRHEKRGHCADLAISHFIDDRIDVLCHLRGLVPHLYLYGHQAPDVVAADWVRPVTSWAAVRAALLDGKPDEAGRDTLRQPDAVRCMEEQRASRRHRG